MKRVTYLLRGELTEPMIPATVASCSALPGVRRVQLTPTAIPNETILTLECISDPTKVLEAGLTSVMNTKGLEIIFDSRTVTDLSDGDPSAPAATRPMPSEEFPTVPAADVSDAEHYVTSPAPKRGRTVTLAAAISGMLTAVVLAVLITFSLTVSYTKSETPPTADSGQGNVEGERDVFDQLEFLDRLFRSCTVTELGDDFPAAILKSYVAATGDIYAEYFTAEELKDLEDKQNGEMCGIGITVVNGTCPVDGMEYQAIVVANVYPNSPAKEAGVLPGDYIMYVGAGDEKVSINEIGYAEALDRITGEEGTTCFFSVYRRTPGTEAYEEVDISAVRRKMTTRSVTGRVYSLDQTVGIIKITGFDNTTRDQFVETLEALKEDGCTSFVMDLRSNPGGLLTSVEDVLTFFVKENDIVISVKDNTNRETVTQVKLNQNGQVLCGTGELTKQDLGKYRDIKFSVLVNEYSASAAELFTANMRDHGLCQVVGTTTFGKGSMQSTIELDRYGYEGALKLTTAYYYPPSGEGYHGIGITPDVEVELSEDVKDININLLTDEQDNQLAAAVAAARADTAN